MQALCCLPWFVNEFCEVEFKDNLTRKSLYTAVRKAFLEKSNKTKATSIDLTRVKRAISRHIVNFRGFQQQVVFNFVLDFFWKILI
jgi:predicted P-loop ATPase